MRLKFNRNSPLEIIGIGEFNSGDIISTNDEARAKRYLDSGYFDIVKEKKKKKVRKSKKSKKKGVDKLCHKDQEDI